MFTLRLLIVSSIFLASAVAQDRVAELPKVIRDLPVPESARNPWPAALEEEYWKRVNACFSHWNFAGKYGGTFFESEKSSYPKAFIDLIEGNREPALKFLQAEDADAHAKKATLGVDWYPSFTIKSQARKYFFFGKDLDPGYRKKMFESAKLWTAKDPLNRPNDFFKNQKEGWNVESKNSWVDVRNTDNLRAMRECVAYLMAEETGNLDTAKIYKERIRAYVTALFNTGMGEWDSANYLHHGLTAWFQLYDFAKDPEVRMLGKAALDWIHTAAAVKYFRGNWAGPNKRDYNNLPQFEGAPGFFWLTFADTPIPPDDPEFDLIHQITSPYRPPVAVVALAGKKFVKSVEILASKPSYDGWFRKPGGEDAPAYYETTYVSEGFQVGTLPDGHQGDTCGFRMASMNAKTGSDIWVLSTALKGYVDGIATGTVGGDRIAQFRNLMIYANPRGDVPFYFLVPNGVKVEEKGGIHFLSTESVWIAVTPVNAKVKGLDAAATASIREGKRPLPGSQIWSAAGSGKGPAALILEIGDRTAHRDFAAFQKAVLANSKADLSGIARGEIHYDGSGGGSVGLRLDGEKFIVFRDGKEHDWKSHMALYATTEASASHPVSLDWKSGVLNVQAGGHTFTGTLHDGRYSFTNQ